MMYIKAYKFDGDYKNWDDEIAHAVDNFYNTFSLFPNTLVAHKSTFSEIYKAVFNSPKMLKNFKKCNADKRVLELEEITIAHYFGDLYSLDFFCSKALHIHFFCLEFSVSDINYIDLSDDDEDDDRNPVFPKAPTPQEIAKILEVDLEIVAENINLNVLESNKILQIRVASYVQTYYLFDGKNSSVYLLHERENGENYYFFTVFNSFEEIFQHIEYSIFSIREEYFKEKSKYKNLSWIFFEPIFVHTIIRQFLFNKLLHIGIKNTFNSDEEINCFLNWFDICFLKSKELHSLNAYQKMQSIKNFEAVAEMLKNASTSEEMKEQIRKNLNGNTSE